MSSLNGKATTVENKNGHGGKQEESHQVKTSLALLQGNMLFSGNSGEETPYESSQL